ncbi:MAG TPA: hypothetical protein VGL93_10560 [Streptosporangiaceae bacterium]
MSLKIADLVAYITADDKGFKTGMSDAEARMRGFQRDTDGRLRDMRGRFVKEGKAAGQGFTAGLGPVMPALAHFRVLVTGGSAAMSVMAKTAKVTAITLGILGVAGAAAAGGLGVAMAGVSLAIAGVGIIAAATSKQVKNAFSSLGKDLKSQLQAAAAPFQPVLLHIAQQVRGLFATLKPAIAQSFQTLAPVVGGFATQLIGALRPFLQSLMGIGQAMGPLVTELGSALGPLLMGIAHMLEPIVGAFLQVHGAVFALIAGVGQLVAALGPLLAGLVRLGAPIIGPLLGLLTQVVKTLTAGLGPAFTQLGPIIADILGFFTRAVAGLQPAIAAFGHLAVVLGTAFGNALAVVLPVLVQVINALAGPLAQVLGIAGTAFAQLMTAIAPLLPPIAQLVAQVVGALVPAIRPLIPIVAQLAGTLGGILVAALRIIVTAITPLLPVFSQLVATIGTALLTAIRQVAPSLLSIVTAFAGLIPVITPLIPPLGQIVSALLPVLVALIRSMAPTIVQLVGLFGQLLTSLVPLMPAIAQLITAIAPLLVMVVQAQTRFAALIMKAIVPLITAFIRFQTTIMGGVAIAIRWVAAHVAPAFQSAKRGVQNAVNGVISVVGWFGSLPGKMSAWIGRTKDAAVSRFNAMVSWVRGLPGKILSGLGRLGTLLVNAGRDLIQGLINGVKAMASSIASTARNVVAGAVSSAKKALGIHSPSKVFKSIGKYVGIGFIDGMTGTQAAIKSKSTQLAKLVRDSFKGEAEKYLLKQVAATNSKLQSLAKQRDSIAAKIKTATDFATSTTQNAQQFAGLTNLGTINDAGDIKTGLTQRLGQLKGFAATIKKLVGMGVSKSLLQQIIAAGPDQGGALADALVHADKATFATINQTQKQIDATAKALGNASADALYDSGKHAADGFLTGLKASENAIDAQMRKAAQTLANAIKAAIKRNTTVSLPAKGNAAGSAIKGTLSNGVHVANVNVVSAGSTFSTRQVAADLAWHL